MCDPVSALMGASTALSGFGQIQSGKAAAAAGAANAAAMERNAEYSEVQARDAIRRGVIEEERKRREGGQIIGSQVASFSAGNLDVGYGSPLDAITATAANIELDALTIRENASREASDIRMQGFNQRAGAAVSRAEGANARTAGLLGAGGSVLDGGAGIYKYRLGSF